MNIVEASCTHCNLKTILPSIPDFVIDDHGEYIPLKHPGERATLEQVLGKGYDPKVLGERLVTYIPMACAACKTQFSVDLKREEPQCSECGSEDVYIIMHYIEKPCPICNEGVIKSTVVGES